MDTYSEGRSLIIKVGRVVKFLQEQEIKCFPGFERELFISSQMHSYKDFPKMSTFESVLKMCGFWKSYCADQDEFSKLVCKKVLSMVKFHAAVVTSNATDEKSYLGGLCRITGELPDCIITVTTYEGGKSIQKGFGCKLEEF